MRCPRCEADTNPTLLYCTACGAPIEADADDVFADEAKKAAELRLIEAVRNARETLITALFFLGCAIALRVVFLEKPVVDRGTAFQVPYSVIEEAGADPAVSLQVEEMTIPIPDPDARKPEPPPDTKRE